MKHSRREYLTTTACLAMTPALNQLLRAADVANVSRPHVATNTYPWLTYAKREDRPFELHSDTLLAEVASTGISGYEPIINKVSEFDGLTKRLKRHGLEMRSIYMNSTLHDEAVSAASAEAAIAIATAAKKIGTRIIVVNPSPIRWGGLENKSDKQLRHQATRLNELGANLQKQGLTLAYHNHDAELRMGGREFHHMLTATEPQNVKLCLDAHWIFRGCGDSEVALFDAVQHYHDRIVELHLRQSENGVWTEIFATEGDIDYLRLFRFLKAKQINPLLILEQAVEQRSSQEMTAVKAHRRSLANLASVGSFFS